MSTMTSKNTQAEIVAEARNIFPGVRELGNYYVHLHLQELKEKTGVSYSRQVKDSKYQLVSVSYDAKGKSTIVEHSDYLPFYESKAFCLSFKADELNAIYNKES